MRNIIDAIESEFQRYKTLAEGALAQLGDDDLHRKFGNGNSVATLLQHVGGNLNSRFTEFLTSDGEKPWRDRESEFASRPASRQDLLAMWEEGWKALFASLAALSDDQLGATVTIRGASLSVMDALTRSIAHTSYHVGQIVLIARSIRGDQWRYLSIPPVLPSHKMGDNES